MTFRRLTFLYRHNLHGGRHNRTDAAVTVTVEIATAYTSILYLPRFEPN